MKDAIQPQLRCWLLHTILSSETQSPNCAETVGSLTAVPKHARAQTGCRTSARVFSCAMIVRQLLLQTGPRPHVTRAWFLTCKGQLAGLTNRGQYDESSSATVRAKACLSQTRRAFANKAASESDCTEFPDLTVDGKSQDAPFYITSMSLCLKSGRWDLALNMFRLMKSHGIQMQTLSVNYALHAHAKSQHWEDALELYSLSCHARIQTTATTFNTLMNACNRGHAWQMALAILEPTRLTKLNTQDFHAFMLFFCVCCDCLCFGVGQKSRGANAAKSDRSGFLQLPYRHQRMRKSW